MLRGRGADATASRPRVGRVQRGKIAAPPHGFHHVSQDAPSALHSSPLDTPRQHARVSPRRRSKPPTAPRATKSLYPAAAGCCMRAAGGTHDLQGVEDNCVLSRMHLTNRAARQDSSTHRSRPAAKTLSTIVVLHAAWCNCLGVSHAEWCNCLVSIACSVCVCVCVCVCGCGRMHAITHTPGRITGKMADRAIMAFQDRWADGGMGKFGSAALGGRARRGLGAVRGRGSRLRGRWSFRRLGFGARGRATVAPITVLALAPHAVGRGTVRCRAATRRRWGGGMRGPGPSGRGWRALGCTRCLRGRGGSASTSGLHCRVSEGRSGSACPGRRTQGRWAYACRALTK